MEPLPSTATGAQVAFYATVGIFVLLEQRIRLRSWRSGRDRQGSRPERGSLVVVIASILAGGIGAFVAASDLTGAAIRSGRWAWFVVGLVLMWTGIAIRQWAVSLLGPFFTVDVRVQPGQAVVDRGPYRWVRHPSYTGLVVTFVGMGLALGNVVSLAVLAVVPTFGLVVRIHVEERILSEALGEPYRRFAAGRRRLFPGLW